MPIPGFSPELMAQSLRHALQRPFFGICKPADLFSVRSVSATTTRVNMAAGTFRNLVVWQEAMKLAELVYRQTSSLPKSEMFGLSSQMRRAATSIPSNIAEGAARNSTGELLQFLGIANGSLAELETQLELGARLGYFEPGSDCAKQTVRVGKLLIGMRKTVRDRKNGLHG